ncbi:MAG: hypothetical protein M1817_005318 [Caeruleum heppii]|nr:MAG: hypothetical protein M1817_005318 [Caeruleum heppii]
MPAPAASPRPPTANLDDPRRVANDKQDSKDQEQTDQHESHQNTFGLPGRSEPTASSISTYHRNANDSRKKPISNSRTASIGSPRKLRRPVSVTRRLISAQSKTITSSPTSNPSQKRTASLNRLPFKISHWYPPTPGTISQMPNSFNFAEMTVSPNSFHNEMHRFGSTSSDTGRWTNLRSDGTSSSPKSVNSLSIPKIPQYDYEGLYQQASEQIRNLQYKAAVAALKEQEARQELADCRQELMDALRNQKSAKVSPKPPHTTSTLQLSSKRGPPRAPRYWTPGKAGASSSPVTPSSQGGEAQQFLYDNMPDQLTEMNISTYMSRIQLALMDKDWSKAEVLCYEAIHAAKSLDFLPLVAKCTYWLAVTEFEQGREAQAAESCRRALPAKGVYREGELIEELKKKVTERTSTRGLMYDSR